MSVQAPTPRRRRVPPFSQQLRRGGIGAVAAGALALPVAGGSTGWEGFTMLTMLGFGLLLAGRRIHRGRRPRLGTHRVEQLLMLSAGVGGAAGWMLSLLFGDHSYRPVDIALAVAPWPLIAASLGATAAVELAIRRSARPVE